MSKINYAIEIGSSNTYIYRIGTGFQLVEPSLIAVKNLTNEVFAVGNEAKKLIGKTNSSITVISPIEHGVVTNQQMADQMFKCFFKKIMPKQNPFDSTNVLLCVSNGLSDKQVDDFRGIIYSAGIGNVKVVSASVTSLAGADVNIDRPSAVISLNIGGGTTDFAVVSLNDIVSGFSVTFGGKDIDKTIKQYLEATAKLDISILTAEKLKNECLSLYVNDTTNLEVSGIDLKTKTPRTEVIFSSDIVVPVLSFFDDICDGINHLVNMCSPEVASDIAPNGIVLTGGVARLPGLSDYITKKVGLPCFVPDEPELATTLGGAKYILSDKYKKM